MPTTAHPEATEAAVTAQATTLRLWTLFTAAHGRRERLEDWTETQSRTGGLVVSARIAAADPLRALAVFTAAHSAHLDAEVMPQLDCTVPEETALVWRSGGVWVRLWAPSPSDVPAPRPAAVVRRAVPVLSRPSARLPLPRRTPGAALTGPERAA